MTIRTVLFSLFGALALTLLGLMGIQIWHAYQVNRVSAVQMRSFEVRNAVVTAMLALDTERGEVFLALATTNTRDARQTAADRTDILLSKAAKALREYGLPGVIVEREVLDSLRLSLLPLRAGAKPGFSSSNPIVRKQIADKWFQDATDIIDRIASIRLRLLAQSQPVDAELTALFQLRAHVLSEMHYLASNMALIQAQAARFPNIDRVTLSLAEKNIVRADISLALIAEYRGLVSKELADNIGILTDRVRTVLRPAEETVLAAFGEGNMPHAAYFTVWRPVSAEALDAFTGLHADLSKISENRLHQLLSASGRALTLWLSAFWCTFLAILWAAYTVLMRVVRPLHVMREQMLQLADGDLSLAVTAGNPMPEIGAMQDALCVFRASAERRARLEDEQLALHGRLKETYRQLKEDLEAAAAIQISLLPTSARFGDITLSSYFRPSHYLAGDTYDVFHQPDGRLIVFQIDVAGHGAAAALVSVASHYTVMQAILQRAAEASLADLAIEVNRCWPIDLPYFTLLLAEIDTKGQCGRLVQAGHPGPFLLTRDGVLQALGDGGLPIGVLLDPTFEVVDFAFSKGDRLIVLTDGAYELANPSGELYSEERLTELLRNSSAQTTTALLDTLDSSLRNWASTKALDDDVTVVILEGDNPDENDGECEKRPDRADGR